MSTPTDASARLVGITLEQYSGVTAAISVGLPLARVLAQEQIDAATWPAAARAWSEAIAGSSEVLIEHMQKRRIADDCLARKISPLEDDPAAWVGLLGALALAEAPGDLVGALGITMADVGRIGRAWKRRATSDPALAARMQELAPSAAAPTKLDVGPLELRRFPWSPAPPPPPANKDTRGALGVGAALPERAIGEVERNLASFQIAEQRALAPRSGLGAPDLPPPPPPAPAPPPSSAGAQLVVTAMPAVDASTKPVTPFEVLDPAARGVTLVRYAETVAALQAPHADRRAVLAKIDLDEASFEAVNAYYERRFSREARWALEFGRLLNEAQKARAAREAKRSDPELGAEEATVADEPLSAPSSTKPPELSVEQYAWVLATLRRASEAELPGVLARLRLSPETRAALDATWDAKTRRDPALSRALDQALAKLGAPPRAKPWVRDTADMPAANKGIPTMPFAVPGPPKTK
ncbi:MAG: hypothetical protein U0414_23940 [Polyangiaceae bacterium]